MLGCNKQAEEPLGRGVGINKKAQIKLFRRDLLGQARKVCINEEEGDEPFIFLFVADVGDEEIFGNESAAEDDDNDAVSSQVDRIGENDSDISLFLLLSSSSVDIVVVLL